MNRDFKELEFCIGGIQSLGRMTRDLDTKALLNDLVEMISEPGRMPTDIRWTDPINPSDDYLNKTVELMGRHGFEVSREALTKTINSDFGRSLIPTVRGGGDFLFGPDTPPADPDRPFPGDPRVAITAGVVVVVVIVVAVIVGWPKKAN